MAAIGGLFERLVLTRLKTNPLGQVLVTLGMSFIISDACLLFWGGDSIPVPTPQNLQAPTRILGFVFPTYRLVLVGCAIGAAIVLYYLLDRTRLGAMIRAGVDDGQMARAVGIPVSRSVYDRVLSGRGHRRRRWRAGWTDPVGLSRA